LTNRDKYDLALLRCQLRMAK